MSTGSTPVRTKRPVSINSSSRPPAGKTLRLPAFPVWALHPGVEFGHIRHLHPGAIPHYFFMQAGLHREIAEQRELRQAGAVLEWNRSFRFSRAYRVQKIDENVF